MRNLLSIILTMTLQLPVLALASPVELRVSPTTIEAQSSRYYYYNFGSVRVNWSQYADLYLRNTGQEPLQIRGIYITGAAFWAWSQCPEFLFPGQSCRTRVEFRPWHEGYFSGALRFKFPDGNIIVDLYGWGVRY
nr:hypothetical protein CKG001_20240 [Bdellovibrio sp. CKG001]BFD63324.1 hypothetical protein BdHM001_20050 [Bdellovibrio sp. HM001]